MPKQPDEINESLIASTMARNSTHYENLEVELPDAVTAKTSNLSHLEPVNIWEWHRTGFIAQYFVVGMIYGGLPATVYGVFLGYLNVPSYVYMTASVICNLPW